MSNSIIQPNAPVEIEWRNMRRQYRERQIGNIYLVQVEVDKEAWDALETVPRATDGKAVLWYFPPSGEETDPAKPKKSKSKGPYGAQWYALRVAGFLNCPGVREAIDEARLHPAEDRWQILHRMFDVTSLATVGPERIYERFPPESYPQASVMVEQAIRKTEGQAEAESEKAEG